MKLFDRITANTRAFTSSERTLVTYLLSQHPHGVLDSATAIAKKTGVSASTVVRLFSKLGYASFAEVQREIRSEISSKLASPSQRVNLAISQEHSLASIVDDVLSYDKGNIDATRESLDLAQLDAIVRVLARPRRGARVFVIGGKNSHAVAHYLCTHLNLCRPDVHLLDAQHALLADDLLWVGQHDVLCAISIRRYSRIIEQTAQHFRRVGARVIAITDSPTAPIAGLSDHRVLIHTASASPFDSYTAAMSLSNAIITAVALRRQKAVEALLERGEAVWNHFGVFSTKAPAQK